MVTEHTTGLCSISLKHFLLPICHEIPPVQDGILYLILDVENLTAANPKKLFVLQKPASLSFPTRDQQRVGCSHLAEGKYKTAPDAWVRTNKTWVSLAASGQSVTLPPSRRNGVPLPPGPMPLPLQGPPASGCCIEMWLAPRGRWTEREGGSSAQTQKVIKKKKLSAIRLAQKKKKYN